MNKRFGGLCLLCAGATLLAAFCLPSSGPLAFASPTQNPSDESAREQQSMRAFAAMASVLTSPRCLNCHIPGETPLHGDGGKSHKELNIKRGPDGRGTPAMRCSNCHQSENSTALHAPPGVPHWRLPPPSMPMAWQGLGTGDLCRRLKDPGKNGNKTLPELFRHMDEDPLVRWGWNPGPGRSIPPLSHEVFMARVKEWIDTGAVCAR
jgi:hypothetical protein